MNNPINQEVSSCDATTGMNPVIEVPGTVIGRYKLLEQVGEGGFGVVYVAEQREPVKRRVALKIIKLGMDTKQVVARFEAERQALALMDHPNIAKVFDGGATDTGRPYFVMELVRGISITEYCDENNLPSLERLELFMQVCHAIQHAHQKGIIHRDIKPSNILVTLHDGVPVPKVIDFGIAKATQGELTDKTLYTKFQQFIGTPAYMSPEQAEMSALDVDTRSDIYSLGVLLYELLTGKTPFDAKELLAAGLDQMRRTIREKEPVRPSTRLSTMLEGELTSTAKHRASEPPKLIKLVRGDLDWIVMKALEKDRTRRYETANELASDINRHLNHEAVLASPPSTAYRFQKLVRRNKVTFAAVAAVAAALIVGLAVSTWMFARERKSRQKAVLAERKADSALAAEASQRQLAEEAGKNESLLRERVQRDELMARRNLYAADMLVAQQAIEEGDFGRAHQRLNDHVPRAGQADLRGFEWRYFWHRARGDEVETINSDAGENRYLSLSPDGRLMAAGHKIWDTTSRRLLQKLTDQETALAFAPKGQILLVAGKDVSGKHIFKRVDIATGQEALLLPDERVWVVAFSRTGRWLGTGSSRGLTLWDTATWEKVRFEPSIRFNEFFNAKGMAFSPDERMLITCTGPVHMEGGALHCWKIPSMEPIPLQADTVKNASCITFSPDGRQFFTGCWDGNLRVWNTTTLAELPEQRSLRHHRSWISEIDFLPRTEKLVTAGADRCIRVWQPGSGQPPVTLRGHTDEIWATALSPDGTTIYSAGRDRTVKRWAARAPDQPEFGSEAGRRLVPVGLSADGQTLVTLTEAGSMPRATSTGALKFWDLNQRDPSEIVSRRWEANEFENLPPNPWLGWGMVVVSADLKWLVLARTNQLVELWAIDERKNYPLPGSLRRYFVGAAFSPNSKLLAVNGTRLTVDLWEVTTRRMIASIPPPGVPGMVVPVSFATKTNVVAIAGSEKVLLWDIALGQPRREFKAHPFVRFALSPDGLVLATGSVDNKIRLYDCQTGEPIGAPLTGHLSSPKSFCFSPDGRTLVSGSDDRRVKLWNLITRREVASHEHEGSAMFTLFSADGSMLVTSDVGRTIRLWRAPSWSEIEAAEKASAK